MENLKKDTGKTRYDLVPWGELAVTDADFSVEAVLSALQTWWTGKPFALQLPLPRRQLLGLAAVLTMGAAKYEPRAWEKGIAFSRVFAAACRHAYAHLAGDGVDPESGLPHENHLWANVVFLVTFTARGRTDLDDRPEASASTKARLDLLQALGAQLSGQAPVSAAGLAGGGKETN